MITEVSEAKEQRGKESPIERKESRDFRKMGRKEWVLRVGKLMWKSFGKWVVGVGFDLWDRGCGWGE